MKQVNKQILNDQIATTSTFNKETVGGTIYEMFENMPQGVAVTHGAIAKYLGFSYKDNNNFYFELQAILKTMVKKGQLSELTNGSSDYANRAFIPSHKYKVDWS
jgi:hypothetical protein